MTKEEAYRINLIAQASKDTDQPVNFGKSLGQRLAEKTLTKDAPSDAK